MKRSSLTLIILTAAASLPSICAAKSAEIYWEAESASSIQAPLKKVLNGPDKKIFGSGYLELSQAKNADKASASYKVRAKKEGKYYLWVRTMWVDSKSNSVGIAVNGGRALTLGEDGTYNRWHWVGGVHRVKFRAGVNTVVLRDIQPGAKIDRFLLAIDNDSYGGRGDPTQPSR